MTEDKSSEIHIGEFINKSSDCEKLLGSKFHSKLVKKLTKNCEH